jgi:hypothetical protein
VYEIGLEPDGRLQFHSGIQEASISGTRWPC